MLNRHHFFRNSLFLILTLALILLSAGCCKQAVDTDDSPVEMHKGSSPKFPKTPFPPPNTPIRPP